MPETAGPGGALPTRSRSVVRWTILYGLLLVILIAQSPLRSIGDGREYVMYALSFAHGQGPTMTAEEIDGLGARLRVHERDLGVRPFDGWALQARDGQYEFAHFWLYSALAAPFVAVTEIVGANPRAGFVFLNAGILIVAFLFVCRRLGVAAAFLFGASPILWWSDKAHPEVMMFGFCIIAFLLWRERPWISIVLAGMVATQSPPFAGLVPLLIAAAVFDRPGVVRSITFRVAVAAGIAIAAFPPIWYLLRHGRASLIGAASVSMMWPTWKELTTPLFDLNIGLLPNHPLFALAVAASVIAVGISDRRRLLRPDVLAAAAGAVILLFAFPQVRHFVHGGTPGLSRHGVWLIPFALPVIAAGLELRKGRTVLAGLALCATIYCVWIYPPRIPQARYQEQPTWIAQQVWRRWPGWSHPLPAVFAALLKPERTTLPVAAPGCVKVLLVGRGESQGMWPRPCIPEPVPANCREPGVMCWANRADGGYDFVELTGQEQPFPYDPASVWPRQVEAKVREVLRGIDWSPMSRGVRRGILLGVEKALIEGGFQGDGRLTLLLSAVQSGAKVAVQAPLGLEAFVIDGATAELIDVPIPVRSPDSSTVMFELPHRESVVLVLRPPR